MADLRIPQPKRQGCLCSISAENTEQNGIARFSRLSADMLTGGLHPHEGK
jgi:hypothetical protein